MSEQNTENKKTSDADGAEQDQGQLTEAQQLSQLLEKSKNDFLYLKAEFENYKRNAIKERSEIIKYGSERVLVDVLSVVDNFERALEVPLSAQNLEVFKKGIDLTAVDLKAALKKHGISEVESLNKKFDPAVHEAIGTEPTSEFESGHISKVFKKPYKLHDKVIRHGQVIIATTPIKSDS